MKFSIIHPSRNRAQLAYETFLHWTSNMSGKNDFEYILSIDEDDSCLDDYNLLFKDKAEIIVNIGKSSTVIAINKAASQCKGEIIVVVSDDFLCFENWDEAILDNIGSNDDFALKTNDGTQGWLITLPILSRKYYERLGYVYHPRYTHLFADTHMTHLADLLGKKMSCNLNFKHNHYTVGGIQKDAVSERADSTWATGEAIYLEDCKNNFGLGDEIDIFKLPKEAQTHIEWIKQRL